MKMVTLASIMFWLVSATSTAEINLDAIVDDRQEDGEAPDDSNCLLQTSTRHERLGFGKGQPGRSERSNVSSFSQSGAHSNATSQGQSGAHSNATSQGPLSTLGDSTASSARSVENLLKVYEPDTEHDTMWSAATIENAYFHVMQVRANSGDLKYGSILGNSPEWQTFFWIANQKWRLGHVQTVCEIGMGPGFSAIAFLVATTYSQKSGKWNHGAKLYEFDIGMDVDDGYSDQKQQSYKYIEDVFHGRAKFTWGDSSPNVIAAAERGDVVCDIAHIDGSHSKEGVVKDLRAMQRLSTPNTTVFLDDMDWESISMATEECKDILHIDDKMTMETGSGVPPTFNAWDETFASESYRQGRKTSKHFAVAHFLYN